MMKNEGKKPKIVYVGVGSAGIEALKILQKSEISKEIKSVIVGVHIEELNKCEADVKIKLPYPNILTPMIYPWIYRDAAIKVYDEIKEALMVARDPDSIHTNKSEE